MKKLVIATVGALGLAIDCMVMWHKADVNNNGTLEGKEATAYLDAIRKSGKNYEMKTVGQLSSTEFMAACKDDAFKISFIAFSSVSRSGEGAGVGRLRVHHSPR